MASGIIAIFFTKLDATLGMRRIKKVQPNGNFRIVKVGNMYQLKGTNVDSVWVKK